MSRDPFDEMKGMNPVPSEEQPPAPMAMAERIIGKGARPPRRAWSGLAVATTAAMAVIAVGGALLWLTRPASDDGFANGGPTTTVAPVTTTTTAEDPVVGYEEAVYFFVDSVGDGWSGGPFLIPVALAWESADDAPLDELLARVMERLLAGVGEEASSIPAMSTAIPSDTGINGVAWEGATGVVTVDLTAEFVSGGGSFSMQGRLAQVVYTLTGGIHGVTGVRFEIDGVPTTVFGGEGVMIGDPATRDEFEAFLPAIMIESPAHHGTAGNPLVAFGSARVFEATVSIALTDADGLILWEGFTTATDSMDRRGDWWIEIPYEIDIGQWGSLIVWESSAEDGRQTNVREHRVWLIPAGSTTPVTTTIPPGGPACSGAEWVTPLQDQGLPQVVAATRAAIWDAAVECDWAQLERLVGDGVGYSFATDDDPIGYWQDLETSGGEPMRYLAELLTRPYGERMVDGLTYYVWPSAFGRDWPEVTAAERDALRPLYGDDHFAFYDEFGSYIGYRIGIAADGTWMFFIAGD